MSVEESVEDTQLRALIAGSLPEDELARLEQRLEEEPALQQRLEELAGALSFHDEFSAAEPTSSGESDQLTSLIDDLKKDTLQPPSPTPSLVAGILRPPGEPDSIGRLGEYEIESHIASGGMGVVYRARDPKLNRTVAIKVLSPSCADDQSVDRFLREATAAAAIEHPHVLPIYAVDTESAELPFIVMRFIEGQSLEQLLSHHDGPLPFDQILLIAKAVTSALVAAHQKELIHRDLKPSNILIEGDSSADTTQIDTSRTTTTHPIYLTDFGLARIAADQSITVPGTFLGTPQFSSPEQAKGKACHHQSDLFSLGSVLYNLATGTSPFSGEDNALTSVIYRVVHEPHRPAHELNNDLPLWFSDLIDHLLQKDPDQRPNSATAVFRCLEQQSLEGVTPKKSPIALALVAIGLVAAVLVFIFSQPNEPTPEQTNKTGQATQGFGESDIVLLHTEDGLQRYPSLATAIKAAPPNAVLEIASNGPIVEDTLEIPAGKPLTIRAASNYRPQLKNRRLNHSLIRSHSTLILEGLFCRGDFDQDVDAQPFIDMRQGDFYAAGCRFELDTDLRKKEERKNLNLPAMMSVTGCTEFTLLNCESIAVGTAGVRFLEPAKDQSLTITLRNTLIGGVSAVEVIHGVDADQRLQFNLENTFICGHRVLLFFGADEPFPISVKARRNIIAGDGPAIATPLRVQILAQYLTWQGIRNIYTPIKQLVRGGIRTPRPPRRDHEGIEALKRLVGSENVLGSECLDLNYRSFLERFRRNPSRISARGLLEVPADANPIPGTGLSNIEIVGPGEPYHQWRETEEAKHWPKLLPLAEPGSPAE